MYLVYDKQRAAADYGVAPGWRSHTPMHSWSPIAQSLSPWSPGSDTDTDHFVDASELHWSERPGEASPVRMAIGALRRAGVPVYLPPDEAPQQEHRARHAKWLVDEDESICACRVEAPYESMHPPSDEYGLYGLELMSPVYSYDRDDWRGKIAKVLEVLRRAFDDRGESDCYRLYVPQMAGMHVHVGLGELVGEEPRVVKYMLPLRSLKNFMQLATGFERITDELHATSRIDCRGEYCTPPSRFYKTRNGKEPKPLTFFEDFMDSTKEANGEVPSLEHVSSDDGSLPEIPTEELTRVSPGIVADALDTVEAYSTNNPKSFDDVKARIFDPQWRDQKLKALQDAREGGERLAFKVAVLVAATLENALSHWSPLAYFYRPEIAMEYSREDETGQRTRVTYIQNVYNEVGALAMMLPRSPPPRVVTGSSSPRTASEVDSEQMDTRSSPTDEPEAEAIVGRAYGTTVIERCQYIEDYIQTHLDIDNRQFTYKRSQAYNLMNFDVGYNGLLKRSCLGTIEFRQHRGTIDADEVIAWVEVATSMLRFAHTRALTQGSMMPVVEQHAYDPAMGFDPFLRMIDVPETTLEYYHK